MTLRLQFFHESVCDSSQVLSLSPLVCVANVFLSCSLFEHSSEGLDGGFWNSLISKNLVHYSLSLKFLLIL